VSKIKRGGFLFISWIGDHDPKHVHVFRDDRLICKWDLENRRVMEGEITRQILKYIDELEEEGH
jgi:hypothetical protein